MVKRNVIVLCLFAVLLLGVLLEQNYINNSLKTMEKEVFCLREEIETEQNNSTQHLLQIKKYWEDKEFVLSLFVDYKEIEQIGRQIELIYAHLNNVDFELALVECELLLHIIKTYYNTVCFDWQNII